MLGTQNILAREALNLFGGSNISHTTSGGVDFYKWGRLVYATCFSSSATTSALASGGTIAQIPTGYRPIQGLSVTGYSSNVPANGGSGDAAHFIRIHFSWDGKITYVGTASDRTIASGSSLRFSVCYLSQN